MPVQFVEIIVNNAHLDLAVINVSQIIICYSLVILNVLIALRMDILKIVKLMELAYVQIVVVIAQYVILLVLVNNVT